MDNRGSRRNIVTIAFIVGLTVVLVGILYHFRDYSPYAIKSRAPGESEVVLSLQDVEFVGRSEGERQWSFEASKVDVMRRSSASTLTGIANGRFYDGDRVIMRLSAAKAVYDAAFGDVEVTGGVKLTADKGFKVETSRAEWSGYDQILKCPDKVTFVGLNSKLVGNNLIADPKKRIVTMDKARLVVEIENASKQQDVKTPAAGDSIL